MLSAVISAFAPVFRVLGKCSASDRISSEEYFSLEGLFADSKIRSCPTSTIGLDCAEPDVDKLWTSSRPASRLGSVPEDFGSARSRSSSLASSCQSTPCELMESPGLMTCTPGHVHDIYYPLHLSVKNTFVHASIGRPPSLDDFYEERQLHSCPVSSLAAYPPPEDETIDAVMLPSTPTTADDEASDGWHAAGAKTGRDMLHGVHDICLQHASTIPHPPLEQPVVDVMQFPVAHSPLQTFAQLASDGEAEVVLVDGFWQPAFVFPSAGSGGHFSGACNPCAHFYAAKGCRNGIQCYFCHMCPPGELKRRQKSKGKYCKGQGNS